MYSSTSKHTDKQGNRDMIIKKQSGINMEFVKTETEITVTMSKEGAAPAHYTVKLGRKVYKSKLMMKKQDGSSVNVPFTDEEIVKLNRFILGRVLHTFDHPVRLREFMDTHNTGESWADRDGLNVYEYI